MKGIDRLSNYFGEKYKEDIAKKEKIESFMDELRADPIKITQTLVNEAEKLFQDAQENQNLDKNFGSGVHDTLSGTVITNDMRKVQAQCAELFGQLEGLKTESESVYRKNAKLATYNLVAKEQRDNAKKLFQDVAQSMKMLEPYTKSHF